MSSLTPGELEVMRVLWEHNALTPAEIQNELPDAIQNAALRFRLRVLLDKGHVAREKVGRAYRYRAITPRRGALSGMIRQMSRVFAGGSVAGLVAQLMEAKELTPDEVEELRRLAQEQTQDSAPEPSDDEEA